MIQDTGQLTITYTSLLGGKQKKKQKLSETEENNHASNKTRNTWDGALRAKQQPYHTLSQGEKHTS